MDGVLEGEMVEESSSTTIDDEGSAVVIDGEQQSTVWGDAGCANIFGIFEWKSETGRFFHIYLENMLLLEYFAR